MLVIDLLHQSHAASYNDTDDTARDLVADAIDVLIGNCAPMFHDPEKSMFQMKSEYTLSPQGKEGYVVFVTLYDIQVLKTPHFSVEIQAFEWAQEHIAEAMKKLLNA